MKTLLLLSLSGALAWAQAGNEKVSELLQERALFDAVSRMKTDERIAMYSTLVKTKPEDLHYAPDEPLPELGGVYEIAFDLPELA